MNKEHDVIIVGAGPAGCSAAICLARFGYDILLVDKARFPREKVCGDGISPPSINALDRLGVLPALLARNPWKVEGMHFYSPAGRDVIAPFAHLNGTYKYGVVFPRKELDHLLWKHACSRPEVRAVEECEASKFLYEGTRIAGILAKQGNHPAEFRGRVVIGADGVYSRLAREISVRGRTFRDYSFAVRAYFDQVDGLNRHIEIHCERLLLPGYGWIFPTGPDSANVGVGIASSYLKKKVMKELFHEFIDSPNLRERFRRARISERGLKGSLIPMGGFGRRRSYRNVLLLGDAGGFADVLTGEGIYHALRGGECASEAVHQGLSARGGGERVGEIYDGLWKKIFTPRESWIGNMIQRILIGEFFLNFHVGRASRNPVMARDLASILCHEKTKMGLLF